MDAGPRGFIFWTSSRSPSSRPRAAGCLRLRLFTAALDAGASRASLTVLLEPSWSAARRPASWSTTMVCAGGLLEVCWRFAGGLLAGGPRVASWARSTILAARDPSPVRAVKPSSSSRQQQKNIQPILDVVISLATVRRSPFTSVSSPVEEETPRPNGQTAKRGIPRMPTHAQHKLGCGVFFVVRTAQRRALAGGSRTPTLNVYFIF